MTICQIIPKFKTYAQKSTKFDKGIWSGKGLNLLVWFSKCHYTDNQELY